MSLRAAIEALTVHSISGYEWECGSCHYHFTGHVCHIPGHGTPLHDSEVDGDGNPSSHDNLIDRDAVLRLVVEEAS